MATLGAVGYPVATVLAGLGIGGLALAFGAQKTIENLFGSISLAADQPFRVGDFVKIEDFTGNVERIGMRSTQIRTLDRTLISLPNGKLADMRIEDFASRDRIRFAATVGLVYGTTEEQVRRVVAGIEAMLRANPKVWPDVVVARLARLRRLLARRRGPVLVPDERLRRVPRLPAGGAPRDHEDRAEAGTSLAFPTRTVHVVGATDRSARRRPALRRSADRVDRVEGRRARALRDAAVRVRGQVLEELEDRLRLVRRAGRGGQLLARPAGRSAVAQRGHDLALQVEDRGGRLLARLDAGLVVGVDVRRGARRGRPRARRARSARRRCAASTSATRDA